MIAGILEKASLEIENRPLVAIDQVLKAFSDAEKEKISAFRPDLALKVFVKAIRFKILGKEADLSKDHSLDTLFSQDFARQDKRFIAICLLRLLCVNNKYFGKKSELYTKTFALFDDVLSEDLYRRLKIETKDQTYKKESKLMDAVPMIESSIRDTMSSLNSLQVLPRFRRSFMKEINDILSKAIIWPFVPKRLLGIRLDEIFQSVEEYRSSTGLDVLRFFRETQETLDAYAKEATSHKTGYSVDFLGGLAEKLKTLSSKNFSRNPASKSAALKVRKSEKKYPFSAVGTNVDLRFIVENSGPGYAFDTYISFQATDNIQVQQPVYYLKRLEPMSLEIEITAKVMVAEKIALVDIEVSWTNFDRSSNKKTFNLELQGQRSGIMWEDLRKEEPYSLEPVVTGAQLVDRREIVDQLLAQAQAQNVGSSFIYGQKRVGKTSVVRTLQTHLTGQNLPNYLVVYTEVGACIHPDPEKTIEYLGKRICQKIRKADNRFSKLNIPDFTGALSPLVDFLDQVLEVAPNYHILFILDEFDELPLPLYKRGPLGDAFFLTIRNISGEPSFGFIFVGGEKMEFIKSCQGEKMNKFYPIRLDYFGRENNWSDFQELVRKPVSPWLEVSDDALETLYEIVAGNPYFTKLICSSLYKLMIERRDCHATYAEVRMAKDRTLSTIASNSFQHFWEDGIPEVGEKKEKISIRRRKVLLCIADSYRREGVARKNDILKSKIANSLNPPISNDDLHEFERRQVLIEKDGLLDCKLPLFREWLVKKGLEEIITSFSDVDAVLKRKQQEEATYVTSEEIVQIVANWDLYQGRRVAEDNVRAWLRQFGDNSDQRLMFQILQNITFYTEDRIRSKMRVARGIVERGLTRKIEGSKRKRANILVSYLDSPGKSGAYYAKLYADENEIYYSNVIERSRLSEVLERSDGVEALVFLDDFMGTGDSACQYFSKMAQECGELLRNKAGLQTFFVTICGFETAKVRVEKALQRLCLSVNVHICDPLDESAKCFNEQSQIFSDATERDRAKNLAYSHGSSLAKGDPLGYGDCQATVVFAHSCPNNSLPILWKESKSPPWRPLFRRF